MRLLSVPVLILLVLAAPGPDEPQRQSSAAATAQDLKGLEEFLNWAHPGADGCETPVDVAIVQTWDGGLRARYRIVCGSSASALEGVFKVREKEGVWQIAGGFEGDATRIDALLGPARLGGKPLTYFRPVELTFSGLPPESRGWVHRALFDVEAIVSDDELVVEEALRRVRAGEPFDKVAAPSRGLGPARGGDWGFVSAATLPAAVRKALHEAHVGGLAGPVSAEGLHYLLLKRGEVYYALRPRPDGELSYQILHQKNGLEGEALKQAVESDIADYMAESRRQAYLNEAARVMGIRQVSTDIGQLAIRTDVLDEEETRTLGQVVEATIRAHEEFWAPIVSLRSFNQQVLVYAWARQADHDRLHRLWQADRVGVAAEPPPGASAAGRPKVWSFVGEYIPSSRILSVPCERMGGHLPVPIAIHEAIHMPDY